MRGPMNVKFTYVVCPGLRVYYMGVETSVVSVKECPRFSFKILYATTTSFHILTLPLFTITLAHVVVTKRLYLTRVFICSNYKL
jgi:hypothetical protein